MSAVIRLTDPEGNTVCRSEEGSEHIAENYTALLTDESRKSGIVPDRIYFPTDTNEVAAALREITGRGEKTVISGARTGIVGGAIAAAENLISFEGLKGPITVGRTGEGEWTARVGAGITLEELKAAISSRSYEIRGTESPPEDLFYPVDPTETSASLGGTVATNASGARTLKYGPTREWVHGITAVTATGHILALARGTAMPGNPALDLMLPDGSVTRFTGGALSPPATKHTAGYHLTKDMDVLDLFIGGEGTLCAVTEVELKLARLPKARLYLVLYLPEDTPVKPVLSLLQLSPAALEYMDNRSLDLLRAAKEAHEDSGAVPEIPDGAKAALYLEFEAEQDGELDDIYARLEEILLDRDIPEDFTWAGFDSSDLEAMKAFRHALPERINSIIGHRKLNIPDLTKVGTDMAVPIGALAEMHDEYRQRLEEAHIEYCIFGHIGNSHLHVNILPRSMDELETAYALYTDFARRAVALGGSVAGEHGIGRLKKKFMDIQYNRQELELMKEVKRFFDPEGTLNPGVLYDF